MGESIRNIPGLEAEADPLKKFVQDVQEEVCEKSKKKLTQEQVNQYNESIRNRIDSKTKELGEKLSETLKVTPYDDHKTAKDKMEAVTKAESWLTTFGSKLVKLIERALKMFVEAVAHVITNRISQAFGEFRAIFFDNNYYSPLNVLIICNVSQADYILQ